MTSFQRFVTLAALVAFATDARAQSRWLFIKSSGGTTIAMDTTRISKTGDSKYAAWLSWAWDKKRKTAAGNSYERAMTHFEVDCKASMTRTLSAVYYLNGEVSESAQPTDQWTEPIPDSYGESSLRSVCHVATGAFAEELKRFMESESRADSILIHHCFSVDISERVRTLCRQSLDTTSAHAAQAAKATSKLDSLFKLTRMPGPEPIRQHN